jgi:hypothetical protein
MVAELQSLEKPVQKPSTLANAGILQRKCKKCRENEKILQRSAVNSASETVPPIVHEVLRSPGQPLDASTRAFIEPRFSHDFSQTPVHSKSPASIQAKLTVNAPGDIYEQEADRIAHQVMAQPANTNVSSTSTRIQRFSGQMSGGMNAAPSSVDQALASSGRPLEPTLRQDMEQRFGQDFSRVRVHTGTAAEQSAHDVNAHAYTVGPNVVFSAGRYAPETYEGRRLIAHELTHVVQQARSPIHHIQRDKGSPPKATTPKSPEEAPESKKVLAQVSAIERNWARVKGLASGFAETKGWISKGDAVVALIREHTMRSLDAIAANDLELINDYKYLLEGDLAAYRFVIWHTFVYQNLARLRSQVDNLISSFDADKTHYTGRGEAETAARELKRLMDTLKNDSATNLSAIITDHPIKIRAGSVNEVSVIVTSAADKKKRAALEEETSNIIKLQLAVQTVLEHTNKFLRTAMKEGFLYAVESVKEYIEVTNYIVDTDGGPSFDDSQKSDESKKDEGKREKKTGGREKYRCDAKCQIQCPEGVKDWAHGTSNKNCSEATRNAKSAVPRGCYPRHCNCRDTEGFIGTGHECESHTR